MPLGLVSTQALLVFHGACSAKLPFFQTAAAVTVTAGTTGEVGGICMGLIEYLSKCLLSTFSLKYRQYAKRGVWYYQPVARGLATSEHSHARSDIQISAYYKWDGNS